MKGRAVILDPVQKRTWVTERVDPRAPEDERVDQVFEEMRETLPTVVRRAPSTRYRAIVERMAKDAVASYREYGRWVMPASMELTLREIAWKNADPGLMSLGGYEGVIQQVEALARHFVESGERSQHLQDSKRVTRNWSGH